MRWAILVLAVAALCLVLLLFFRADVLQDPVPLGEALEARDPMVRLPLLRGRAPTGEERLDAAPDDGVVPEGVGRGFPVTDGDVVGRVVGPDGTTLRYAVVQAFVEGPGGSREVLGSVGTAALGRFWLRLSRPAERVHIAVLPPPDAEEPYAPTVIRDVVTGAAGQEIELRAGVWLEGEVVDGAGRTVEGGQVVLCPANGVSEAARRVNVATGSFRIPVTPGPHRIFADPRRAGLTCSPVREVRAPSSDVRLVCPVGVTVTGRLLGNDVEGFRVGWSRATADGAGHSGAAYVQGPEGRFVLEHVPPESVMLYAWKDGDDRCVVKRVEPTAEVVHELVLVPGLSIEGMVVGGDARDTLRWLMVWDRQLEVWRHQRVEGDGTFRVRGLPPGRYDLSVGGARRANAVAAGTAGVRIEVSRAQR